MEPSVEESLEAEVNDTFALLPPEVRWEFALEWDLTTLGRLCNVSRSINVLCQDDEFWKAKFRRDLGRRLKYEGHEEELWKQNYVLAFQHSTEPIQDLRDLELLILAQDQGIIEEDIHVPREKLLEELTNLYTFGQLYWIRDSMIPITFGTMREDGTTSSLELKIEETVRILRLFGIHIKELEDVILTSVSSKIEYLHDLEVMDFSLNPGLVLPPEIGNLSSLQELYLIAIRLSVIPPEIFRLSSLKILNLSYNRLTRLPPEIFLLSFLEELNLSRNRLTRLTQYIGDLYHLRKFDVSQNKLTTLPPQIGLLSSLEELDVSQNKLTTLPVEITSLSSLEELNLNANRLTDLPREMGNLYRLRELSLAFNPLGSLPPELHEMPDLHITFVEEDI